MRKETITCSLLVLFALFCVTACDSALIDGEIDSAESLVSADLNTNGSIIIKESETEKLYFDFIEMIKQVESMNLSEIDTFNNVEIRELGLPLEQATAQTTYFDDRVLNDLFPHMKRLSVNFESLSESSINVIAERIERILEKNQPFGNSNNQKYNDDTLITDEYRTMDVSDMRDFFKSWVSDSTQNESCKILFNKIHDTIFLGSGENLSIANYVCPSNSNFILRGGSYSKQFVLHSKEGNQWIGLRDVTLDGDFATLRAFYEGLDKNMIANLNMQNYYYHGIFSSAHPSDVKINRVTFRDIAPDSSGQDYGAIKLDNATNVTVSHSHFENVASAVRFRFSNGPLKVIDNTALNIGRNFFQCDDCNGPGIQINRNSMERTRAYGVAVLEDWINIFKSNGEPTDWIQVNNNRARGHSLSGSGSFIMLGDDGGSYQEAVGNIGVNPGQVGIGIAGGENIKVQENAMFSVPWDSSNVAYYSALYSPSCGNHLYPGEADGAEPNRANWMCGDKYNCVNPPILNTAWADGQCGIDIHKIRQNVRVDRSMGPEIWNEW